MDRIMQHVELQNRKVYRVTLCQVFSASEMKVSSLTICLKVGQFAPGDLGLQTFSGW